MKIQFSKKNIFNGIICKLRKIFKYTNLKKNLYSLKKIVVLKKKKRNS